MKQRIVTWVVAVAMLAVVTLQPAQAEAPSCVVATDALCYQPTATKLLQVLLSVTEPPIAVPAWLGE